MKGDKGVIDHLNALLRGELTAIDQYFLHADMYEDFGFHRLYEKAHHEMMEEKEHADWLIKRILFLEGKPNLVDREPLNAGHDVPSMLKNDLALEYAVIKHLKEVIKYCEEVRDYVTREILEQMLKDTEEDHAYWLEKQLGLIEKVGLANYLQSQIGSGTTP